MRVIGLGHYSGVGKDTLADRIIDVCKCVRPGIVAVKGSFAYLLKRQLFDCFSWAGLKEPEHYDLTENRHERNETLPALGMTPVELWVKYGNMIRDEFHPDAWVNSLFSRVEGVADVLVIPDVRFYNEVQAIRDRQGIVVKVTRPGVVPKNTVSDQSLSSYNGWDFAVDNAGTIADLTPVVKSFAEWCVSDSLRADIIAPILSRGGQTQEVSDGQEEKDE